MALCIRTVPSKLLSFVGTISQTQLDRRLTKLIGTSSLLHEVHYIPKKNPQDNYTLASVYKTTDCLKNINKINNEVKLYANVSQLPKRTADLPQDEFSNDRPKDHIPGQAPSDQLMRVYKTLQTDLPRFFTAMMDYTIYHREIEFINHFKGTVTQGLSSYMKQILLLRVGGHLMYAMVKLEVLKITIHPEDSTIKVRWRIRGLSAFKAFFNFWKFKWLKSVGGISSLETWYDGFSTFYVNAEGLVYRHVADKMMPDEEIEPVKAKPDIAAKLAA